MDFNDVQPRPDTKYGVPPASSNNNNHNKNNLKPPSPTYGVPGHEPGSPSTRISNFPPNEYEQPPTTFVVSTPAPTYGVPKNSYIPPINSFQLNPSIQSPNYYIDNRVLSKGSSEGGGGGYVYDKPNANLQNFPLTAQLQGKRTDGSDSSSKSDESEELIRNIQFTTESPRAAPDFFFSEQFETTPTPTPTVVTSSHPILQKEQNQQHAFHPQEQPFLPNSPPAPFSTAVYQERSLNLQQPEQLEPLPTLATDTLPPLPEAKNFYRTDTKRQTRTIYNQADWFKRISRSLTNGSESVEVKRSGPNSTYFNDLRSSKELLESLFSSNGDEELEEDLIINFEAAHSGGNRTSRKKRQSVFTNRLCETTTQFIEPQAALTRDGQY